MNVLMVTWHDLGCHLGCYGRRDVASPNLDRLASEGARFESLFACNPICSPSRASLMTGLYPHRHGLQGLVHDGWHLKEDTNLIEDYFSAAGYHTALVGHQHERRPATTCRCDDLWVDSSKASDVVPQVCSRLEKYAASGQKFFLRTGFSEVHRPLLSESDEGWENVDPLPYLKDTEEHRRQLAKYHKLIHRADRAVGEILNRLESVGLAENTVVFFVTDHGVPFPGAKLLLYDAGLRIAGIVRAPKIIPAGTVIESLVSGADVLPTLLDLASVCYEPGFFDGKSAAPALKNEAFSPRKYIYAERAMPVVMRAVRDERFKYIVNFDRYAPQRLLGTEEITTSISMAIPDHLRRNTPIEELYDLIEDPCEQNNLAASETHSDVKRRLLSELKLWMHSTNDPVLCRDVLSPAFESALRIVTDSP